MHQGAGLVGQGRGESGVGVPERRHPEPRQEVEVAPAVGVVDVASLAPGQDHRHPLVDLQQVLALERPDALRLGRVRRSCRHR